MLSIPPHVRARPPLYFRWGWPVERHVRPKPPYRGFPRIRPTLSDSHSGQAFKKLFRRTFPQESRSSSAPKTSAIGVARLHVRAKPPYPRPAPPPSDPGVSAMCVQNLPIRVEDLPIRSPERSQAPLNSRSRIPRTVHVRARPPYPEGSRVECRLRRPTNVPGAAKP